MENSDDNSDEDETEWKTGLTDFTVAPSPDYGTGFNRLQTASPQRVILHFDLDCFYAQVEMLRNPALRNVPLGIQQKSIVVTCNYVAREQGVTKLMSVVDAQEKCPQLVLVTGEDLTHYREMSYQVTDLLTSYCPLVERLGFDENYVDITEMVEKRLTHCSSFQGHVYNRSGIETNPGPHRRLAVGSHIAAELRAAVCSRLGLSGCAGVATNKLLAKLVSGSFKPNQQTTLLPQDVEHLMDHLGGLRRVPGVGHQTGKRLQALGLVTVQDLQLFPLAGLVKEFGVPTGQRLKNLSLGVDDSPVVPTGAPQSLSDEDSFKKITTTREVVEKTQELLTSLVGRMQRDGRAPRTFRLTLRRYSENKGFSRESRQCPVPPPLGHKVVSGSSDATVHLVTMAMKLFNKMVDGSAAFHLTLLNVCFTNLLPARGAPAPGQGAITSFFTLGSCPPSSPAPSRTHEERPPSRSREVERKPQCGNTEHDFQMKTLAERSVASEADQPASAPTKSLVVPPDVSAHSGAACSTQPPPEHCWTPGGRTFTLPPNVDPHVFWELPEDIQKELLSPAFTRTHPTPSAWASRRPAPTPLPLSCGPDPDPAFTRTLATPLPLSCGPDPDPAFTRTLATPLPLSCGPDPDPAFTRTLATPLPLSCGPDPDPAFTRTLATPLPLSCGPDPDPAFTRTLATPLPLSCGPDPDPAFTRTLATPLPLSCGPVPDPASQSPPPLRSPGDSHPLPGREGSDTLPTTTGPGEPPTADPQRAGGQVPGHVDPAVFSELPLEVQRELMVGWRQQKALLKAPSSVKPERKSTSKHRKAGVKGARQNDLYQYFKPS